MFEFNEAERMRHIPFSEIRRLFEQVTRRKNEGLPTVAFHVGSPDFDTPDHIKEAAKQALDEGMTAYTSNYGIPELRTALARKLARDNGIQADPNTQIIVTVGTNEAIMMVMMGLLNPGDEVLIPDPSWLHYRYCAALAGATVVPVPLNERDGFQLNPDDIARRITPRTRMLLINTPHNPTGAVYREETLLGIAALVEKHGLLLISDEIYEKIIFNSTRHISPGSFENIAAQTITVNGFSKAYAMTGWRLGYVVAAPQIIKTLVRVHQYTTICAPSFAQAGAVAALEGPQQPMFDMIEAFDQRRQVVEAVLRETPGVSLVSPQGAFYAFPKISPLGLSSNEFAERILSEAGVALVPGSAFGDEGEGFIRIAYSCSLDDVQRGMSALRAFCERVG
ncbi:MAG: pyridoxal phosphate-dependent aminotransferase [bacterium]|nr:pyridoxal phosphate-dependent aminotransferase [bacterium]